MTTWGNHSRFAAAAAALSGLFVIGVACDSDDPADSDSAAATSSETDAPASTGDAEDSGEGTGSSDGASDASTSSGSSSSSTTGDADSDSDDGSSSGDAGSTSASSDSGAGTTGLEGFCERYFECGGSFYADTEACMDASLGFWGECAEARAALDAFGDCMITIPCEDYNPDAYNPASTDCAEQWQDVMAASC